MAIRKSYQKILLLLLLQKRSLTNGKKVSNFIKKGHLKKIKNNMSKLSRKRKNNSMALYKHFYEIFFPNDFNKNYL